MTMIRFKIEVFCFNSKAEREILYDRNMEISEDFCCSLVVDHYRKVLMTLYPKAVGVNFIFM